MNLPYELPAWLPWWIPLVLLVPTLLWILAFLLVPFSVIGLKSRMDGLEARLDEIQADIRTVALRLPESGHPVEFDELYTAPEPVQPTRRVPVISRPPIPPAAYQPQPEELREPPPPGSVPRDARRTEPQRREPRTEPRLDWPR
jgi:hypothetical protein